ncbi:MAG: 2Fe-2S iron-sulfur cluster-binding protein [Gammaproteobacteria bacterium]
MTAKVTLQPSGHSYTVEPDETVLEAALRSGLNLNYHCSNGTCGECRARLLEGTIHEIQHHDYVLSTTEKAQGQVLLCRARIIDDIVVEASEAGSIADIPVQELTTQVSSVENPQQDITVLTLRTPRSQTLRFLAGQHVTINIPGLSPRNKSIASCPCNGMFLQIHQRQIEGDSFSDYLFNQVRPREKIKVEGPFGGFVLDETSQRPIIFLAFDTGFSSIKSLIEHAVSLDIPQAITLYWVMPYKRAHYLENYCYSWQDALDNFSYIPVCAMASEETKDDLNQAQNALVQAASRVTDDHPDLSGFDVYITGPQAAMQVARHWLLAHGLIEQQLFIDQIRRF